MSSIMCEKVFINHDDSLETLNNFFFNVLEWNYLYIYSFIVVVVVELFKNKINFVLSLMV